MEASITLGSSYLGDHAMLEEENYICMWRPKYVKKMTVPVYFVSSSNIDFQITYPGHFIFSFLNLFFLLEKISCIFWKYSIQSANGFKCLEESCWCKIRSHVQQAFKYENLILSIMNLFVGKRSFCF